MESRMDDFRAFVSKHPKLRDEVRSGKRTWQNIYEEWVLYGENNDSFRAYEENKKELNNINLNMDSVKNVLNYIKKINPDDLNKTLNTVQKVIQIAQTVGASKSSGITQAVSGVYSDWWD